MRSITGSESQNKIGVFTPTDPPASPGEGPPNASLGPKEVNWIKHGSGEDPTSAQLDTITT